MTNQISMTECLKQFVSNFVIRVSSFLPLQRRATRPGFEPGQIEPKSIVLPLHLRVIDVCEGDTKTYGRRSVGFAKFRRATVRGTNSSRRPSAVQTAIHAG